MVTLYLEGETKTTQLTDWSLYYHNQRECLQLSWRIDGKSLTCPFSACRIDPTILATGTLLIRKKYPGVQLIERAQIVGNKYVLIYYPGNARTYVMKAEDVQILEETSLKSDDVFSYFHHVAQQRVQHASHDKSSIAGNILRQLDKIVAHPDTALEAYCRGSNARRQPPVHFIYPFGLNASQMKAVEQAFSHQISVIEGPPGTGKTQTILNILANILLQNRSVAMVSNNNAAVNNVYHKLEKAGLDYVVARLGSQENRQNFFSDPPKMPQQAPPPAPEPGLITQKITRLKQYLSAQNKLATLHAELNELETEEKHLSQWLQSHGITHLPEVKRYKLAQHKITDLIAWLHTLTENRLTLRNRLTLLIKFAIIRTDHFNTSEKRQALYFALQCHYYVVRRCQTEKALSQCQEILQSNNVTELQHDLIQDSMSVLRAHLWQSIVPGEALNNSNYQQEFAAFLQRYPITGSSTHSIINSLPTGALLDYVIIDEASQQDIIPGILALACARNVIVVGDRKQLPHVAENIAVPAPAVPYDCARNSLPDSLFALYGDALPVTLLREHYRCHPKIIQFCNRQFYDNQLIVMTHDNEEPALSLVVTAKGNHERHNSNLRELESLMALEWDETNSLGIIAPYNAQVALSHRTLSGNFISATVHKFQGRECEKIIFSTVLDKKADHRSLSFVDDPHLINVAVSRARKHFTLVTGDNIFTANNQHIAALIRYITYYADDDQLHYSPVVSAFDLLYEEYDHSLDDRT